MAAPTFLLRNQIFYHCPAAAEDMGRPHHDSCWLLQSLCRERSPFTLSVSTPHKGNPTLLRALCRAYVL